MLNLLSLRHRNRIFFDNCMVHFLRHNLSCQRFVHSHVGLGRYHFDLLLTLKALITVVVKLINFIKDA